MAGHWAVLEHSGSITGSKTPATCRESVMHVDKVEPRSPGSVKEQGGDVKSVTWNLPEHIKVSGQPQTPGDGAPALLGAICTSRTFLRFR